MNSSTFSFRQQLQRAQIIPIVTIEDVKSAIPLAEAIVAGGLNLIEITLRSNIALEAISMVRQKFTECLIAAGTVKSPHELAQAKQAGAHFIVSPGMTIELIEAAKQNHLDYLPGVVTPSEMLTAKAHGINLVKFFPANLYGGINALKAFSTIFPDLQFCPTGGITVANMNDYLNLKNVICIGGSWLAPQSLIENKKWDEITQLIKTAIQQIKK